MVCVEYGKYSAVYCGPQKWHSFDFVYLMAKPPDLAYCYQEHEPERD
ncbi:hypothetical protein [Candidatus Nitrosotenuis cloacae]|jgi:hypothetical protein|nr:hypothetical protein [Candidatus Nitrosotenuis cloacae]